MMRFLCAYKSRLDPSAPPTAEAAAAMAQLRKEMTMAGVLLATEACMDGSHGARVRIDGNELIATDGPLAEPRRPLMAAVLLLQLQTKAEAVHWCKRFLQITGEGELEIRQLFDARA